MSQEANYSYIQWLPENRMVTAIQQAMLNDKYISGLFGKNIFGYSRDDNATFMLPSISISHGELFSYDNYDRLEGEIKLSLFFGTNLIRAKTTEIIQTSLATVRLRTQNNLFIQQVSLNMFNYNETLSSFSNTFDKAQFIQAMKTKHPLTRFAINFKYTTPEASKLNGADCYEAKITYRYWLMQQDYFEFLELLGVNVQNDPNEIVYPPWEQTEIFIKEL